MADEGFAGGCECRLAETDAFALHRYQHGEEGRLNLVKYFGLTAFFELWLKDFPELKCDIGVFDRIVGEVLLRHVRVVDGFALFSVWQ